MTDKRSTFPLPLSSVQGDPKRSSPAPKVATPQTATQNAARTKSAPSYAVSAPAPAPFPVSAARNTPTAPFAARAASAPAPAPYVASPVRTPAPALMQVTGRSPHPVVSDAVRQAMVLTVAKMGVQDPVVLQALGTVPRHLFIEPGLSGQAYINASLPIGHHQTISQPYIVARMIEVMRNGGQLQRVLEIGTGCGYQAAVLACVAQDVYSIERIKPLHELAKNNLRPLRIANLRLHYGDGMLGLPQAAPFDGIILAAAGLEVPHALLEQLSIGGRLVAPVGAKNQHLQLITRTGKHDWTSDTLEDCHFVPLRPGTV